MRNLTVLSFCLMGMLLSSSSFADDTGQEFESAANACLVNLENNEGCMAQCIAGGDEIPQPCYEKCGVDKDGYEICLAELGFDTSGNSIPQD